MTSYLKQSTATQNRLIGPFIDDTDGKTAETGLTIANTDIRLSKNGANMAAKNSGGGTHDEAGWYQVTYNATDTGTVGLLQVEVDVAGALPVFHEYWVLEEAIYDALFAASAAAFDANQRVDLGAILGVAQSATDLKDFADDGYDPATNKVQGVVLVDTTTTNTDVRGTDSALLASSAPTNFGDLAITATDGRVDVGEWLGAAVNALQSGRVDGYVGAMAANVITAAVIADAAIDSATLASDMDTYIFDIVILKGSSNDEYSIRAHKNGELITSGITSPTIQVIKDSDATDLIASTALTEIGSLGKYKHSEGTNRITDGSAYGVQVQATIDGATRTGEFGIGRDA